MILTDEFLSWSRRQRMNAFNAALEAEYAGRLVAGTMARFELVLSLLYICSYLARNTALTKSNLSLSSCSSGMVGTSLSGPRSKRSWWRFQSGNPVN